MPVITTETVSSSASKLPITSVSYSRLALYEECPRKFWHKYVDKQEGVDVIQTALIKGSLTHSIIEVFLAGHTKIDALSLALPLWVNQVCNLPIVESKKEMMDGKGIYLESLLDYAESLSDVLLRCSPGYMGPDAIRNKDGKAPADPMKFPPKAFLDAYNHLAIHKLERTIDITAQRLHKDFQEGAISLAKICAEAYAFALGFEYPSYFKKTLNIELQVNPEGSEIEILPGVKWNGFIDWVFEDIDGKITICDHKTNKLLPNDKEANHHDQLNLYACLYYERTGVWPDYIGINHLRSNTIVRVPAKIGVATYIYAHYKEVAQQIVSPAEKWLRRSPNKPYGSACAKMMGMDLVTCPALSTCWPDFELIF